MKLVNVYAEILLQHVRLQCDDVKFIQTAWSSSLRSLVDRKAQTATAQCRLIEVETPNKEYCPLIFDKGGREKFIDFIALERRGVERSP